ncbi:MAG TPA: hemerythrin domain-containing protein [Kofleriaceae bacterium]|nr:hemerythrin domain-containing protein [Kofleriaceae bacterium]
MRVDLFSMIHKGVRSLLFEVALEAARVDLTSAAAIDNLASRIDTVLQFLDEHARIEETYVMPALRALDAALAEELGAEHRALEVVQIEVERATAALEQADLAARGEAGAKLIRVVNHLVSVQLVHMNREETEIMATLWAGLKDVDLGALRMRMAESLPAERRLAWRGVLEASISPVERRLVLGAPLG